MNGGTKEKAQDAKNDSHILWAGGIFSASALPLFMAVVAYFLLKEIFLLQWCVGLLLLGTGIALLRTVKGGKSLVAMGIVVAVAGFLVGAAIAIAIFSIDTPIHLVAHY